MRSSQLPPPTRHPMRTLWIWKVAQRKDRYLPAVFSELVAELEEDVSVDAEEPDDSPVLPLPDAESVEVEDDALLERP
jgi:hypothetical protein